MTKNETKWDQYFVQIYIILNKTKQVVESDKHQEYEKIAIIKCFSISLSHLIF